MKKGEKYSVTWPDGLEMVVTFVKEERGWVVFSDEAGKHVPVAVNRQGTIIKKLKD